MSVQTLLQKVSEKACRFIYKNYFLDEISNGNDTLMYCHGDKMVVNIYNAQDHFDFLFIFNKDEVDRLMARRSEFPLEILSEYNRLNTATLVLVCEFPLMIWKVGSLPKN
ncbi:MAG: hypothetical protein FWC78_07625 [Defluviitaleaceae bacterium]|nr:hypothetical protein [Defluviitaleaceae bacterium]